MNNEQGPLFETAEQIRAFDDYRGLGIGRNLEKLIALYRIQHEQGESVPTLAPQTLSKWSRDHNWDARCAEHEAYLAERSEALIAEDRAVKKRKRLKDYDLVSDICRDMLMQLKDGIEPQWDPALERWISPLSVKELVAMLPKLGATIIKANTASRAELGEDVQRHHVTVEQVVNAFPPELREPLREQLYREIMGSHMGGDKE